MTPSFPTFCTLRIAETAASNNFYIFGKYVVIIYDHICHVEIKNEMHISSKCHNLMQQEILAVFVASMFKLETKDLKNIQKISEV